MKTRKGFTLVEILIVVVILGILAAIVIPQFSQASAEASESALVSNLQSIRGQIELYKIQHLDALPANAVALTAALTTVTDINGVLWVAGAGTAYGPYMRAIPVNPFTKTAVIGDATGAGVDWLYTYTALTNTYSFVADDSVAHAAY